MPDLFADLDHAWISFASSRAGDAALHRWQIIEPLLTGFGDLGQLAVAARDIEGDDLDARDELHLALLRLAQHDVDARQAILHLLRPALSATARLYSDTWEPEDAASMVLVVALEQIVGYPHGRPRPAARIVRAVRHSLWVARLKHLVAAEVFGTTCPIAEVILPAHDDRCASDEVVALVDEAVRTGRLKADQARLILLHRVFGFPTAEIAARQGYPASTIRQRRSRAEAAVAAMALDSVA